MAQITIDARKYFDFGIGTYIQRLTEGLANLRSGHSYRLLISQEDHGKIVAPKGWDVESIPYGKYSVSEFFLLGRKVKSQSSDVIFHSPHYTLPLGVRGCSVVTIHDLIPLRLPQLFSAVQRLYAYAMMGHAVRQARFVLTASEFTRQDILKLFRVPPDKVIAIHLGVSSRFRILTAREKERFRIERDLTRPYVLFVGNPKPHKGIQTLLHAFAHIAPSFPDLDLVVAGGMPPRKSIFNDLIQVLGMDTRVKFLGHVDDEELVRVYNCAEMLVMPSLYEGFGLPALEAMACGTSVAVSAAGSLPEVVGDAALMFQPGNPYSLAESMDSLMRDKRLRGAMIEQGKEQVRAFNWKVTAQKTLDVYERILSEKRDL